MEASSSRSAGSVCSLSHLVAKAGWGDVLLFRCRSMTAAALRVVTLCEWDHVAVVVNDSEGNLLMLESCVAGTLVFPLQSRLHEYSREFADAVGWRRLLRTQLPDETGCEAAMRAFVDDVDGLRAAAPRDAPKMMLTPSGCWLEEPRWLNGHGAGRPIVPHPPVAESYFCSETVVELWRRCGLVPSGIGAAAFWPPDMADGGKLEPLLESTKCARLEPMLRVDFNIERGSSTTESSTTEVPLGVVHKPVRPAAYVGVGDSLLCGGARKAY